METIEVQISELTMLANIIDTCNYIIFNWSDDIDVNNFIIEARDKLRKALQILNAKEVK